MTTIEESVLVPPRRRLKHSLSDDMNANLDGNLPLHRAKKVSHKQAEIADQILRKVNIYRTDHSTETLRFSKHVRPSNSKGPKQSQYLPVTPPAYDDPELLGCKLGNGEQKCLSDPLKMKDAGFPPTFFDPSIESRFKPANYFTTKSIRIVPETRS